jgi:hypothetical protein
MAKAKSSSKSRKAPAKSAVKKKVAKRGSK